MLLEIYLIFQILTFTWFCISFFTKNEILWGMTMIFAGSMAMASLSIQYGSTISRYPFLFFMNILVFVLAAVLMIFDLFDKYSNSKAIPPKAL